MVAIRVFYSKTGRARYISHLDTMRTVTRALRRSRLPLWYTEGFNPHLYITFALPLSLGYEGLRESFDVRIAGELPLDEAADKMRAVMPLGFDVTEAAAPVMEPKAIAWADYDVRLFYRPGDIPEAVDAFAAFAAKPRIDVIKRTKKGEKQMDIKPLVDLRASQRDAESLALSLRIASGINLNINPALYLSAFYDEAKLEPKRISVVRTAIMAESLESFR